MEFTVRYGYVASIGSLVWALTKRENDQEGCLTGGK